MKRASRTPNDNVVEHPAYAQISAVRVNGSTRLYGSDFLHDGYVIVRISRSVLGRHLSTDWPSSRETYIEVAMSEAQWAGFVSRMNYGDGVQCTLKWRNGDRVEAIEDNPDRRQQARDELVERFDHAREALKDAHKVLNESKSINKRDAHAIRQALETVLMNITSNVGFVEERFAHHIERTVRDAKTEVDAYIETAIRNRGLEGAGPKLLEQK